MQGYYFVVHIVYCWLRIGEGMGRLLKGLTKVADGVYSYSDIKTVLQQTALELMQDHNREGRNHCN